VLPMSWPSAYLGGSNAVFLRGFAFKSDTFPTSLLALPIIRSEMFLPGTSKTLLQRPFITPDYFESTWRHSDWHGWRI